MKPIPTWKALIPLGFYVKFDAFEARLNWRSERLSRGKSFVALFCFSKANHLATKLQMHLQHKLRLDISRVVHVILCNPFDCHDLLYKGKPILGEKLRSQLWQSSYSVMINLLEDKDYSTQWSDKNEWDKISKLLSNCLRSDKISLKRKVLMRKDVKVKINLLQIRLRPDTEETSTRINETRWNRRGDLDVPEFGFPKAGKSSACIIKIFLSFLINISYINSKYFVNV